MKEENKVVIAAGRCASQDVKVQDLPPPVPQYVYISKEPKLIVNSILSGRSVSPVRNPLSKLNFSGTVGPTPRSKGLNSDFKGTLSTGLLSPNDSPFTRAQLSLLFIHELENSEEANVRFVKPKPRIPGGQSPIGDILGRNKEIISGRFSETEATCFIDFIELKMLETKKRDHLGELQKILHGAHSEQTMTLAEYKRREKQRAKTTGSGSTKSILRKDRKSSQANFKSASLEAKNTQLRRKVYFSTHNTVFVFPRDG